MREIKFRAWHLGRKVMIYDGDIFLEDHHPREWIGKIVEPCVVTSHGLLYWILETRLPNATDEHYDHRQLFSHGINILQYTGLKDKNGKEIYEGDIVAVDCDCDPGDYAICTHPPQFTYVGWFKDNASYELRDPNGKISDMEFCDDYEEVFEVIGNIYENPELLEEAQS